jgi:pimeloyl-ACP methyl ester carboxylesterase
LLGASVVAAATADEGKLAVRGHKLFVTCAGSGAPAVLLESGLGDGHDGWYRVMTLSQKLGVRICAYDRYGIGQSAATRQVKRTIVKAALDLHALSRAEKLAPPYVMVGHSMGGLIVRTYAKLYPADIAGMVLLDSAPDDWDRYTKSRWYGGGGELLDLASASASLRAKDTLGAKPLIVVEAGDLSIPMSYANGAHNFKRYWDSRQRALAKISTSSMFLLATQNDHNLPVGAPALTAAALKLVVRAGQTKTRLPSCSATDLPKLGGTC